MKMILCCALFLFAIRAKAGDDFDPCVMQLPPGLKTAVESAFPKYRVPLASDNLAEKAEDNRRSGGAGCLGVAAADFDGDNAKDFALALTSKTGDQSLIVVALARGRHWRTYVLKHWDKSRARLYVAAIPPGHFARTETLNGPLAKNEKRALDCRNASLEVGETEATAADYPENYCYLKGAWPYVSVAD